MVQGRGWRVCGSGCMIQGPELCLGRARLQLFVRVQVLGSRIHGLKVHHTQGMGPLRDKSSQDGPGSTFHASGFGMLGSGCRVHGSGFRALPRTSASPAALEGSGLRAHGPGSRVQGLGCRVQGPGFKVGSSCCRVQDSGLWVWDSGFCVLV